MHITVSVAEIRKRKRCKNCDGCKAPKCGECKFCTNPNSKQTCVKRRCENLTY